MRDFRFLIILILLFLALVPTTAQADNPNQGSCSVAGNQVTYVGPGTGAVVADYSGAVNFVVVGPQGDMVDGWGIGTNPLDVQTSDGWVITIPDKDLGLTYDFAGILHGGKTGLDVLYKPHYKLYAEC